MENAPKQPGEPTKDDRKASDAADISARIVALKGDSDEYTYAEPPPKPAVAVVPPKVKRRGAVAKVLGAIVIFPHRRICRHPD